MTTQTFRQALTAVWIALEPVLAAWPALEQQLQIILGGVNFHFVAYAVLAVIATIKFLPRLRREGLTMDMIWDLTKLAAHWLLAFLGLGL